jgi:hypothetical protein
MAEHTPAPWRNACFQVYGPKGEKLCHTGGGNLPPSRSDESEANARLIAAAPDLLIACKRLLEVEPPRLITGEERETFRLASAAIAKAEGRSP